MYTKSAHSCVNQVVSFELDFRTHGGMVLVVRAALPLHSLHGGLWPR